jgi:hypothetical protein
MTPAAVVEEVGYQECLSLLRESSVGRVAVVDHGFPVVLPVNFRLVEFATRVWITIRTRPGNVIERAGSEAAFEVDAFDTTHTVGWSVLARGYLEHVDRDAAAFTEAFDPQPWLDDREAWLVIEPFAITGRRVRHSCGRDSAATIWSRTAWSGSAGGSSVGS